jgi:hypothetical protein
MLSSFRKYWIFLSLWLACFSVLTTSESPLNVYAQNVSVEARVTSVSGAATVSGNGRSNSKLVRGAILAPGHEIDTQSGGRVVIDLSDGSQVVVLPGSRIVFGDYRNANSLRELLQISIGRIRVRINHFKNKPNPYRIKSRTASIAVRGTEFEVTVESQGETRVVVLDGAVEVASLNDLQNPLLAEPGRGVVVRPDSALEFFVPGSAANGAKKRGQQNDSSAVNQNDANNEKNSQAANVYERFIENIVQNGEIVAPLRFSAFADAHLDSLDNPAYAAAFTGVEGRVYFSPSFSDVETDDATNNANPVDYGIGLQGTIFVPVNPFRLVVGASGSFVNNGLQSFAGRDNTVFNETIIRSKLATTNNKFFNGSLVFARRFGSRDQTSVGLSYERFKSNGNFNEGFSQMNIDDFLSKEHTHSGYGVRRNSLNFGVKHNFGNVKIGAYYRFGRMTSGKSESSSSFINPFGNFTGVDSKGVSSEVGLRLRGTFSSRFFYGAESSFQFNRSREELQIDAVTESKQRSKINRGTIGFGLGYFLRPRTIFNFDFSGGLIKAGRKRYENLTGNLLENGLQSTRFLSAHAAVQTDVWRNLFVNAAVVTINQSRTNNSTILPDRFGRKLNAAGVFAEGGRIRDSLTDFYSNYGIGYRFAPDFIFQYIVTTDYGKTAPRHNFNFRYTFDFSRE